MRKPRHSPVYVFIVFVNFLYLRSQLQRALKETDRPLRVNSECLYTREGRRGIDRVRDAVEVGLEREVDNIRVIQNTMAAKLDQVQD